MDNINFKGGFFIQKIGKTKWKHVQEELPKHKCVFQSFNENGDKFVATKTHYDGYMLNMLLKKHVDFSFYPDINLKSRLSIYLPEESQEIVNNQTNIITGRKEQLKCLRDINKKNAQTRIFDKVYKWTPEDHIEKTIKVLLLEPSEVNTIIKDGITLIFDKNGKKIAVSSPNTPNGINYVYVLPNNGDDSKRLALNEFGEVLHTFTALEIKSFNKNFKRAVNIDKGRKRSSKL